MERFNNYKISSLLFAFVLALVLTIVSTKADFTFGERVNLKTIIPAIDPTTDAITCFSYDGLEIYILSLRAGGEGGADLWVLRRGSINEDWGPPENLGPAVNSPQDDLSSSISGDGLTLCFCSNRPTGSGRHDIYMTTRAARNAPWGPAVNMGTPINTSSDDVEPWITADGLEFYYASYRPGGYGYCDIWGTKRTTTNDPWGQPVNLGPLVNSAYEEHVTALSPDGLLLLFAGCRTCGSCPTPRPGGYGGDDMWMARRATLSDPWQPAVNLGPIVNGPADNYFPRISPDGSTLYYSEYLGGVWDDYQVPIIPIGFNGDGIVNLKDLSILAQYWGQDEPSVDIGPMSWGDGRVDIHDVAVLVEYWLKDIPELGQAWRPTPADDAINQAKSILYWNAGETATAHDVYFGTDRTSVGNADTSSALYIEQVLETPGVQSFSTKAAILQQASKTYNWRIDEVEEDETIIKGTVWTFTTAGLKAHSPSPADNALLVDPNEPLSWGPGFTARYHEVYLGIDRTAVESADTSSPLYKGRKTSPYTPGTLNKDTWYYWRVDEVETVQTIKYKGDVWQFKTIGTGVGNLL